MENIYDISKNNDYLGIQLTNPVELIDILLNSNENIKKIGVLLSIRDAIMMNTEKQLIEKGTYYFFENDSIIISIILYTDSIEIELIDTINRKIQKLNVKSTSYEYIEKENNTLHYYLNNLYQEVRNKIYILLSKVLEVTKKEEKVNGIVLTLTNSFKSNNNN